MSLGDALRGESTRRARLSAQLEERAGNVVDTTANDIRNTARAVVPVDTGNLRDSIVVAKSSQTRAAVVATATYAGFVESGTSRQAPQPYMSTATEKHRGEFVEAVKRIIE